VISLVLPTYKPGSKLDAIWHAVRGFLDSRPESWEAIFVLDGCTDDTPARFDRLRNEADHEAIRVLGYPKNRGKGHAVRFGLQEARGEIRLFTDVDLAYDFDDIVRVAEAVSDRSPVVVASRAHPDSVLMIPDRMLWYAFKRKLQSNAFRLATRLLTGLNYRDTQAGLKGFTAAAVRHLAPHAECDGFGFDCEWLLACQRACITVAELPVRVKYEEGTTTSSLTGLSMIRELWSIRRKWKKKAIPAFGAVEAGARRLRAA